MSDFKRERIYFILKTKHLNEEQCQKLTGIADSINHPPLECVVVESDLPNYEDTWKAVEQVANGEYQSPYELIEHQQARIEELEQREQELAATVNRLREDLKAILGWRELRDTKNIPIERIEEIAREAIEAAGKQNLNAVKLEVAKAAVKTALINLGEGSLSEQDISSFAKLYANTNYPSDKDGE